MEALRATFAQPCFICAVMSSKGHLQWYNKTLHQYISNDELKQLMKKSNTKAALEMLHTWAWIFAAFALVYFLPNPFTVIVALFILGGKQLACAIIMHDCSHDAVFESRWLNQTLGNWLGAYPILHDLDKYRPYHVQHHIHTGTEEDPDVSLTTGYPTSFVSMLRKLSRDLFFLSGIKAMAGVILMQLGVLRYELNGQVHWLPQKGRSLKSWSSAIAHFISGPLLANALLFVLCWLAGQPLLYLLWPLAMVTTYNFSLRIRSMAEHSMVRERENPQYNTRTIYANFFERLLFAPHHVNFHAEHHLCMGVPSYNLPTMHKLLLERGFYQQGELQHNYLQIVKMAVV